MTDRARYGILAVIALVVGLNYLDRYALSILVEPIRADLRLSDTRIGLLTGAGFALLYSTLAIPVARLAERHSRVLVLTASVLLWSTATALCGLANGFLALLVARILVGCGEAGAIAPSHSIISDLFPIAKRSSAMGLMTMGAGLGITFAPMAGGWLESQVGWRSTFFILGALGLPVAMLFALVVREPRRGLADGAPPPASLPFGESLRRLLGRRTFSLLIPTLILMGIGDYSMALWLPSLLDRSYGISPAELGARLALFQGVPYFLGTFLGGTVADRLSRHDIRWIVWVPAIGTALTAPALLALITAGNLKLALAVLTIPSLVNGIYLGPCYALIQNLAAVHSRATATATLTLAVNLVGAGLGPTLIGLLSDQLSTQFGEQSLRYAYFALVPVYALGAVLFVLMSVSLKRDLEDARRDSFAHARGLAT
jgi:predicted MFS family arabinose efflux permease